MKYFFRNITIKLVADLMIVIMAMLIVNKALFTHSHKTANNTVIVHAHPYNKSTDTNPYKSHLHTNAEYIFLHNLKILSLPGELMLLIFYSICLKKNYPNYRIPAYLKNVILSYSNRAPPSSKTTTDYLRH